MDRLKSFLKSKPMTSIAIILIIVAMCTTLILNINSNSTSVWLQAGGNYQNTRNVVNAQTANEYVYFTTDNGYVYKVDGRSGQEVWKSEGYMWPPFSVSISSSNVYALKNYWGKTKDLYSGEIYALDKSTGEKKWSFLTKEGWIMAQPAIDKGYIYTGSLDYTLYCITERRGEVKWQYKADSGIISPPRIIDSWVFFGTSEGYLYCLDKNGGRLLWKASLNKDVHESPILVGNKVILSSENNLFCFDITSGTILWQKDFPQNITAPVVGNQNIFVGSMDGNIYSIDPNTGQYQSIFKTLGEITFSPAVYDDKLYFSAEGFVVIAINQADGSEVWRLKGNANFSPVSVSYNNVYAGDDKGTLWAIQRSNGQSLWKFDSKNKILTSPAIEGVSRSIISKFLQVH